MEQPKCATSPTMPLTWLDPPGTWLTREEGRDESRSPAASRGVSACRGAI